MLLLLVRHAHAGQRDPQRWPDDRLRPITDKGRDTHRKVCKALARMDLVPDAILTSPWTRAIQTAGVMIENLELDYSPEQTEALAATPDIERIRELLHGRASDATVALVGHSPWMEELASLLLTGDPSRMDIDLPKSGVVGIELANPDRRGSLRFMVRPKQLKK